MNVVSSKQPVIISQKKTLGPVAVVHVRLKLLEYAYSYSMSLYSLCANNHP